MENKNALTGDDLERSGIRFKTKEEADSFLDVVIGVLKERIGNDIAEQVPPDKLAEFDRCITAEEAENWLDQNCPSYGDFVVREKVKIRRELRKYRFNIEGNCHPNIQKNK